MDGRRAFDMYFDSHAHLDDARFADDVEEVIGRAGEACVTRIVTVGQDRATSEKAAVLAQRFPAQVYAAVGIHPHEAKQFSETVFDWLKPLCRNQGVVAIGEIGLDYHYDLSPRTLQKDCFDAQLQLAVETGLPVILHCREAWSDCLEMLERYRGAGVRGVAHCFGGGPEEAVKLLNLGFMISFAGNLTFPNAEALRDVARELPLDRLMIETDCPWLAPQKWRGRRNEPSYVVAVARQIAELHGIACEEAGIVTSANTRGLLGIGA
jgi:TatD DNase family protein